MQTNNKIKELKLSFSRKYYKNTKFIHYAIRNANRKLRAYYRSYKPEEPYQYSAGWID